MDEKKKSQAEVMSKFSSGVVDLMEELDALLRILKFQREALVNSMTDGFGYKKMELNPEHAKLSATLASVYQKTVDAKVKLDKHLRERAEDMSPEEEVQSIELFIKGMNPVGRRKLLITLLEYHNFNCAAMHKIMVE